MAISFMIKKNESIICSGGLFLAKDTKRFLFLLRSQGRTAGTWGIVGGKKEPSDTTAFSALQREITEEIGTLPEIKKTVPLELFVSEDQHFHFNTYLLVVEKEFIPVLNYEHVGYAWCDINHWPKPLHQGVKRSLSNKTNKTKIELLLELI
jgi:8-oxo-dGTP pyrophosphatase MutT (NUDIX family)